MGYEMRMSSYKYLVKRRTIFLFSLLILLFIAVLVSLCIGIFVFDINTVLRILLHPISGDKGLDPLQIRVLWNIRLPRIVMAIVAGMCFGIAGCILQCVLRNPLASPYTIGVASSASFGAALAIILGAGIVYWHGEVIFYENPYLIVLNAFIMSMMCSLLIMSLAYYKGASPGTTILAGIAMTYLFTALTSLLQYFGTTEQVAALVFWTFGDLGKAGWEDIIITTIVLVILAIIVIYLSNNYNALLAGDEVAATLGVNVKLFRIVSLVIASLLTATPVAFIGTIGFIGLLAPHIARLAIGPNHKFLVPASALLGSLLLVVGDLISRIIVSPLILPIGVVTAFMGVPLFLYLLLTRREEYW